jgi:hypothetical protein
MMYWPNLKWYVDWKGCDRKLSRPISENMWIRTNDIGWCHDLIWGDMWIGTDDKECNLTKYKLMCGLEMTWQEVFKTNLKYYVEWNRWYIMMSSPKLKCSVECNRCEFNSVLTSFEVLLRLERMWQEAVTTNLKKFVDYKRW